MPNFINRNECFVLSNEGNWTNQTYLVNTRTGAASVVMNDSLWITGGHYNSDFEMFDTTELVTENGSKAFTPMPMTVMHHCIIKMNETHVLMTGGLQNNDGIRTVFNKTFVFNFETQEWQSGPDLNTAR